MPKNYRIRFLIGVIALMLSVSPHVSAQNIKRINLANKSDPSGTYMIGFCSRPSPDVPKNLPGHAFVILSHIDKAGKRTFKALGHTTKSGAVDAILSYNGWLTAVPGYLAEEVYTSTLQNCLEVTVNKEHYASALAVTIPFFSKIGITPSNAPVLASYELGSEDCLTFSIGVAKPLASLGLKVPDRAKTDLPETYVRRLIDTN